MNRGFKETEGKLDLSLLDDMARALTSVAQVLHYGSLKYEKGNWLEGLDANVLHQAQDRHRKRRILGQKNDTESGLSHLAHQACLLLMELELEMRKDDYKVDELFVPMFRRPKNVMPEGNEGFLTRRSGENRRSPLPHTSWEQVTIDNG